MTPEAILDAPRYGLKVPHLPAFLTDGVYSTGVHGVLPTVTYPSHMTPMTGASPVKHGIYANTTVDPLYRNERDRQSTRSPSQSEFGGGEILDGAA